MKISNYTPRITPQELDRCWIQPREICELAVVGDIEKPEVRRFLSNLSDRDLLPFVKSGAGKTSPKLYSPNAAIGLRVFKEICRNGRTYDFAAPIAAHIMQLARSLVSTLSDLDQLDAGGPDWLVVFSTDHAGRSCSIETLRTVMQGGTSPMIPMENFSLVGNYEFGVIAAGEIIWNVLRHYPDHWARERIIKGLDAPSGRYDGCDVNGMPLDPAHPWNANLPPLERAKRLVEIEEYLAATEKKDTS
jgi:hypothetical protein